MPENPSCDTPSELTSLGQPLPRFAGALQSKDDVTIVAIGSSSTFGEGQAPAMGTWINSKPHSLAVFRVATSICTTPA
jgi:hypothetical protein